MREWVMSRNFVNTFAQFTRASWGSWLLATSIPFLIPKSTFLTSSPSTARARPFAIRKKSTLYSTTAVNVQFSSLKQPFIPHWQIGAHLSFYSPHPHHPEKVVETDKIAAFKKHLERHMNRQRTEGSRPCAGMGLIKIIIMVGTDMVG